MRRAESRTWLVDREIHLIGRVGGTGWLQVLDDATGGFATLRWLQLDYPAYTAAVGTVHPAVGDIDGDGRDEIVAGLGPYAGGWLMVWDDAAANYAGLVWIQMNGTHADLANGATWPAIGRFNR